MKKKMKVILLMALVSIASMLAGGVLPAFAFGPATHQQIAQEELLPYINGGAIAPDWCLAYDLAIGDKEIASHHNEFHSDVYVRMLRCLAQDEERVFTEAYASHVRADKLPHSDIDMAQGESYIILCPELMVRAYGFTYPNSQWQPTVDEIESLYLANIAYQTTLPELPADFENISQLKDLVQDYKENGRKYLLACVYHAQYFSWYAGEAGYNVSWLSIPKKDYNKLFNKITFPSDEKIGRHYICLALVQEKEYLIDPQTGEIVRHYKYWALGK